MYKNLVSIVVLSILLCDAFWVDAEVYFGSKASSIVVGDGSKLEIKTPGNMEINGGNIANRGEGIITGQPIHFNRGVYTFFNSNSDVTAVLQPDNNIVQLGADPVDPLIDGGTMIANPGGLAGVQVDALPGRSLLRGQPLFFGPNDLKLQDETTGLSIAIQNTLNTNITLNGGLLFLQDDLRLGDDAVILDNGHVVFNNRRLSLGGKASTWSGRILWDAAQDIQLNSALTLTGTWIFIGENQINGNGNVIDIGNHGSIVVLDGSTLRLAGVQVKGLAGTGTIKLAQDATLIISDVVIEMENNYNIDSGTIFVEGASTIITKDNILTFTDGSNGTSGKLIVDRVFLNYDTLASIDKLNIQPQLILDPERKHVDILGDGEIGSVRRDTVTFHNYRSQPLLLKYAIVAPYRKFEVFPEVDEQTQERNFDVILDGNTNFMGFTKTDEKIFIVTENVQATTQNITLRDFSPKHVQFNFGSSLVFGDQTTISFARNETLDYKWVFQGQTMLRGAGNILELGPNGVIEVQGENSVLLLDGVIIKGITDTNIRCLNDSCKIVLKDVKWFQNGEFSYNMGSVDILDEVVMQGGINPVSGASSNFIYNSTQPFTILSNSTLSLIRDMIFTYSPISFASNLLVFTDQTAALMLDQATLAVPLAGTSLSLSTGRLIVRNRNFLQGNVIFGQDLFIDQPSGATLEQI